MYEHYVSAKIKPLPPPKKLSTNLQTYPINSLWKPKFTAGNLLRFFGDYTVYLMLNWFSIFVFGSFFLCYFVFTYYVIIVELLSYCTINWVWILKKRVLHKRIDPKQWTPHKLFSYWRLFFSFMWFYMFIWNMEMIKNIYIFYSLCVISRWHSQKTQLFTLVSPLILGSQGSPML